MFHDFEEGIQPSAVLRRARISKSSSSGTRLRSLRGDRDPLPALDNVEPVFVFAFASVCVLDLPEGYLESNLGGWGMEAEIRIRHVSFVPVVLDSSWSDRWPGDNCRL